MTSPPAYDTDHGEGYGFGGEVASASSKKPAPEVTGAFWSAGCGGRCVDRHCI